MKKIIYGLGVFVLVLSAGLWPTTYVKAEDSLESLSAGALLERFVNDLYKVRSVRFELEKLVEAYASKKAKKPTYHNYVSVAGQSVNSNSTKEELNTEAYVELFDGDESYIAELNVISKPGEIYINFPKSKIVSKQWFGIPPEKYSEVGKAIELEQLFDSAILKAENTGRDIGKGMELAKKHNVYQYVQRDIKDGVKIRGAKRFNFELNPNTFAAYYREYVELFEGADKEKLALVSSLLSSSEFVNSIVNQSYLSLWFDEKTNLPVRILNVTIIPKNGYVPELLVVESFALTNINKEVVIQTPRTYKDIGDLVQRFNIKLNGVLDTPESKLQAHLNAYADAGSLHEKEYYAYEVANTYVDLEKKEEASKYYILSSESSKKKSASYYESLAQSEWILGNGAKTKEYLDLALKKDPKADFVLYQYGYFLLGISKTTAQFQDLTKAEFLNERLAGNKPNDEMLLNLYLTYILQNDKSNADALVRRFTNFNTGENHNFIARAYHRLGNSQMAATHKKMAADLGYKQSGYDVEFYAMNF